MEESYWISTNDIVIIAVVKDNKIIGGSTNIRQLFGSGFVSLVSHLEKQGRMSIHKIQQTMEVFRCLPHYQEE